VFYVVSYDIADDRRRNAVAKILEDFGTRVQESVFDCLLEEIALLDLKERLGAVMDRDLDSIRFYPICARCKDSIEVMGIGFVREDQDFLIM
jgi:CRISPR-associated protein Cas2